MSDFDCPRCGHEHTLDSDQDHLITYWGESEPSEFECWECEHEFLVTECVLRTYVTKEKT